MTYTPTQTHTIANLDALATNIIVRWAGFNSRAMGPAADRDDLSQEGQMVWLRIRARYAALPEARQMAVLRTSLRNCLVSLARLCEQDVTASAITEDTLLPGTVTEKESSDTEELLAEAPAWLQPLMDMADQGSGRQLAAMSGARSNEYLCYLAGLDPRMVDLREKVRELLS